MKPEFRVLGDVRRCRQVNVQWFICVFVQGKQAMFLERSPSLVVLTCCNYTRDFRSNLGFPEEFVALLQGLGSDPPTLSAYSSAYSGLSGPWAGIRVVGFIW